MQSNCHTLSRSFLVHFISLVFSAFSWVSPASCSINFCFRSFTVSTTLSYLTNTASIPELHSVMISYSSPCPLLSSYTIGFISWYSSTLLTISLWHLWIGFNKLLPGILFVFLFVSCSISNFFKLFSPVFDSCPCFCHDFFLAGSPLCHNCFSRQTRACYDQEQNCLNGSHPPTVKITISCHVLYLLINPFTKDNL